MIIHDQHVHSSYSFDSKQDIKGYLEKAKELGLSYFVTTEHTDFNYLDEQRDLFFDIDKERAELNLLQSEYPDIKLLQGIEIGYKPSEIDRINDVLNKHSFDLVNLSLHEGFGIDYYYIDDYLRRGIEKTLKGYYSLQLQMVNDFDNFDVLSHLDYGMKTVYLFDKDFDFSEYENYLVEIMKVLIEKDKCLEINLKVQKEFPLEHTKYILDLYKSLGGKNITLSTDAHHLENYRRGFEKYIPVIKECGFDHLCYFVGRKRFNFSI